MDVNDDVLRLILEKLPFKQKVGLVQVSKQFKRVLDGPDGPDDQVDRDHRPGGLFASQKKISFGRTHYNLCAANDASHAISELDVLPLSKKKLRKSHDTNHLKRKKVTFDGIKWTLKHCRNLEVIVVSLECSRVLQYEGLITLSRKLMSKFRNKLTCLAFDAPKFKFTRMHKMRRLTHLRSFEVIAKARNALQEVNPDIVIKENKIEMLANAVGNLAFNEAALVHDDIWGEIPEVVQVDVQDPEFIEWDQEMEG